MMTTSDDVTPGDPAAPVAADLEQALRGRIADLERENRRLMVNRSLWKLRAEAWKEVARVYRKAGRIMSETAVFGARLLNRGWRPFIRSVWMVGRQRERR